MTAVPARTVHLQAMGRVPAVEAQELAAGDELMWNFGYVSTVVKTEAVSPLFLLVTMKNEDSTTSKRRMKKTRLVAVKSARALNAQLPVDNAQAYPASPAGLAAAERDRYAARTQIPNERHHAARIDLHDRCAQLTYRIAEILAEINGASASLPVPPTFGYTTVPQTPDAHCCIVCGDFEAGLVQVAHLAYGVTASVCLRHDGQQVRDLLTAHARRMEVAALAERYPVDTAAAYVPTGGEGHRDVVIVTSAPAEDGTVQAISGRHHGKTIRVALNALQPLPALPPTAEGDVTDWWTVTDHDGTQITMVHATTMEGARAEAGNDPQASAVSERLGGLLYRRLRTSELPPEIAAAAAATKAPDRTVTTCFTRKSLPRRLEESGAPGRMVHSETAGALRWLLPSGEELTPGEAAHRFLS